MLCNIIMELYHVGPNRFYYMDLEFKGIVLMILQCFLPYYLVFLLYLN